MDAVKERALHEAVRNGEVERIRFLLEQGVYVNATDAEGKTPLDRVSQGVISPVREILFEYGAIYSQDSGGFTPLHSAASSGKENIVRIRLENGADVNAVDCNGNTPLHLAVRRCKHRAEIGRLLCLQHEGNRNTLDDLDFIQLSVCIAHARVTKILLSHGANVNAVNISGSTPLHCAVVTANTDIIRLLLENGADIRALTHIRDTPLHSIAAASGVFTENNRSPYYTNEPPTTHTAMLLIKNGANVDAVNMFGVTPLHVLAWQWCCTFLDCNTAKCLIVCGADVNAKDKKKKTPLHYLVVRSYVDESFLRILLDAGADMNATDEEGETVITLARKSRKWEELDCNTWEVVFRHAALLQAAGLYISEKNIQAMNNLRDELEKANCQPDLNLLQYYLNLFKLECGEEVERIESKLTANLSFKYILSTNNPRHLQNETLAQQLESINNNDFPIYGNLLKRKLETDKKKLLLLDEATKAFGVLLARDRRTTQLVIPSELLEKILCYLSNCILQNLILGAGKN